MVAKQPCPGDLIEITKSKKKKEKGILLESHEPGIVLLKLDSGYNLGIKKEDILKMRVVEKADEEKKAKKIKGNNGKPRIDVIITGGTIASSLDSKTGGVKWLTNPETLFQFYPELFELVDVKIKNPFMKASENMGAGDWIRIAKEVVESLNDENCQGVIITHGTDFLHYTSAALSFMVKDLNKPVVLTYSQRSIDRASSDASLNLICSAKAAISDIAEVMLVGHGSTNDDFCYALPGTKVRKMHTSRRDTFQVINSSPIAKITKDKIEVLSRYNKRNKSKPRLRNGFEEKVALIKFYPGQDPNIIDYYVKQGYRGLVIEMSGLGHVLTEGKNNWIPKLKSAIEKGVVICAAPQTLYGGLQPMVYSPGRKLLSLGVIYLKDMLPETALVKLGYVLGTTKSKDPIAIKNLMLENLSGEFNERLGNEFVGC
jgi:glutamyl-tRNA(Gln) amidotransferase subunit D